MVFSFQKVISKCSKTNLICMSFLKKKEQNILLSLYLGASSTMGAQVLSYFIDWFFYDSKLRIPFWLYMSPYFSIISVVATSIIAYFFYFRGGERRWSNVWIYRIINLMLMIVPLIIFRIIYL